MQQEPEKRGGEVVYERAKISKNEITKAKHQWGSDREREREAAREGDEATDAWRSRATAAPT